VGMRYLVTLYRLRDGELLALLDGSLITDLRTGAASGVIARRVTVRDPVTVGIIGSGNQARAQLESLAYVYRIASASVFSPTRANREAFASQMSAKLRMHVKVAETPDAAVRGRSVVVTASKARSQDPVLRASWLDRCRLLCAVGNTRAQFSELDAQCFTGGELIVADTEYAFGEAGEFRRAAAAGTLMPGRRATLAQVVSGEKKVPQQGLVIFKSGGERVAGSRAGRFLLRASRRACRHACGTGSCASAPTHDEAQTREPRPFCPRCVIRTAARRAQSAKLSSKMRALRSLDTKRASRT
jgi:alanine dehydrogenase